MNIYNPSSGGRQIITVAKVDDVNGLGTGALINFVEIWAIDPTSGIPTRIADRTPDLTTAYTLQGTRRNAQDIGVSAKTKVQQLLVGTTWSPPNTAIKFSYEVTDINDPMNPPTFKDSDGTTTELMIGEKNSYDLIEGTSTFDRTQILITANSGVVKVLYTEIA